MNLDRLFIEFSETHQEYNEALKLIEKNSTGKIWLGGGFLFRNLANLLYGGEAPENVDFDFIAEFVNPTITALPGWEILKNNYGNPKFKKGRSRVDLVPLGNILSIQRRGLDPTIENYLTGVPLNIQSMLFDIRSQKLIGEIGLNALRLKNIEVNSLDSVLSTTERRHLTLDEYVTRMADELSFTAKL